jgi:hypothetical protein
MQGNKAATTTTRVAGWLSARKDELGISAWNRHIYVSRMGH